MKTFGSIRWLTGAGAVLLLSGCALWPFSRSEDPPHPVLDEEVGQAESSEEFSANDTHIIADQGRGWQRDVRLPEDGREPNEPGRVRWSIPVNVGPSVRAIAALSRISCQNEGGILPRDWRLETDSGRRGEVWRVGEASDAASAPHRLLNAPTGEELREALGLATHHVVQWIVIPPSEGLNRLVIDWKSDDASRLLDLYPCLEAWVAVPIELALSMTDGTPGYAASQREESPGIQRPDVRQPSEAWTGEQDVITTDEGVSLRDLTGPVGADSVPPGQGTAESAAERLATRLALLDIPEYDLVQIHRTALAYEVGAQGGNVIEQDAAYPSALRSLRRDRLDRIQRRADGEETLCRMTIRHAMGDRPLDIWDEEPTIPPELLGEECRFR